MTWNIHGALGRNPGFDLDRVVALIRRHCPDIVALQEVDSRRPRHGTAGDPFAALREAVGGHGVEARTITTADGDYGQVLVSRWPVADVEVRDLSYPEREPRRAIRADIATPHGPLRVIATDLGLSLRERRRQVFGLLGLDRIFLWPPNALVSSRTDRAARALSDHLPVIGDIRMPPLAVGQERGGTS